MLACGSGICLLFSQVGQFNWQKDLFNFCAAFFKRLRQFERFAKILDRFIECESRWVSGNFKKNAARLMEIDGMEVSSIAHGCDVQGHSRKQLAPLKLCAVARRPERDVMHGSPEGPYTPQMVVNGREQFVGGDVNALQKALGDEARRAHLELSILFSTLSSSGLDVKFSVAGVTSRPLDIVVVVTDDADLSTVLRGENGGKLLQHVSVARSLVRVATVKGATQQSIHIAFPDGFHLDSGSGHHLILFAQDQHQGAIEGAATTAL